MKKHTKVNLRLEDIKSIIEVYELMKFERGYLIDSEEKKTFNRIIRQCKKSIKMSNKLPLIFLIFLCYNHTIAQSNTLCLERSILENVATKLDSFSALKELQPFYESRYNTCLSLNKTQSQVIEYQSQLLKNNKIQISKFESIEIKYQETLNFNDKHLQELLKKNRKQKTINKITLIGGGALTIALTTALLISLL